MVATRRPLSRVLVAGALALTGLTALAPAPARAETSYHKLKKQLRSLERGCGEIGETAAVDMAEAMALILDAVADDECAVTQPAKVAPAAHAAPSHPVSNTRPPAPPHDRPR